MPFVKLGGALAWIETLRVSGDFEAGVGEAIWDKFSGEAAAMLIVRLGLGEGVFGRIPTLSFARIGVELTRTRMVSSVS